MAEGNYSWYAVRVKSNFESAVLRALQGKDFESFLPRYSKVQSWSDRTKKIELPLFPGYVFCRFDARFRLPVLMTPGVVSIVGFGGAPAPIPLGEIDAVRKLVEAKVELNSCSFPAVGQVVRIDWGPLAGIEGILTRINSNHRLVVSISLLMRSVAAEIDVSCIRVSSRGSVEAALQSSL